ncbi:MAG: hypothetical protein KBC36_03660 [Spirochaetia bacterium]|nr:hypothetical protein [Spirochaetia bacterium]
MRTRGAGVLPLLAVLALAVPPAAAQSEWERSASRSYFERAREAAGAGRVTEARALLHSARSFAPAESDALYLEALLGLGLDLPRFEAEAMLKTAIAANGFSAYSMDEARRLLARVLYETKRYDEALATLPGKGADPESDWIRAACLRFSGDRDGFLAALATGMDRHPFDPRFGRLYVDSGGFPSEPAGGSEREIRERVLSRLSSWSLVDPELPALVRLPGREADALAALRAFRAQGGRSGATSVLAVRSGLVSAPRAAAEILSGGSVYRRDVEALIEASRDADEREAITALLLGWSGALLADANGDGIPEARAAYRNGAIVRFELDLDQDGRAELAVHLSEGAPVRAEAVLSGETVSVAYGAWPGVAELAWESGGEVRRYWFAPGAFSLPLLSFDELASSGSRPFRLARRSAVAVPTERAAASLAFAASRVDLRSTESFDIEAGVPADSFRTDAQGVVAVVHRERGAVSLELLDFDGDGIFEGRRTWLADDGELARSTPRLLEVDLDGDGRPDYRETYVPSPSREWDYDGDGLWDASVRPGPDGSETWEFASRFDGRYDTAAIVKDGRILRLFRAGTELALVPDASGSAFWIGRKPFDLGPVLPPSGVGERDGIRYRVYRFKGVAFLEVVE